MFAPALAERDDPHETTYVVSATLHERGTEVPKLVAFEYWGSIITALWRANNLLDEFCGRSTRVRSSSRATTGHLMALAETNDATFRCTIAPLTA